MTPFTDRSGRFSTLKTLTFAVLALPAAWLVYRALAHDLGPLPVKEALLSCGLWSVRFLLVTLALTPAQRLLNLPRLALIRRMTGIAAFAYALMHFMLYVTMEKFSLGFVASEIALRIYLTIGFAALLGLCLLAATSTDAMLRRLGTRWKTLHRLVYVIAGLAVLHFFMQSKIDASEATLMAGLFSLLMIYRGMMRMRLKAGTAILGAAALLAAASTALIEFAWYGLATGLDPWRVLHANAMIAHGLRPAPLVLLAGLAVALVAPRCARRSGWRPVPRLTTA
jgi:sulfoxide reductase heme-binding subunit YedZ